MNAFAVAFVFATLLIVRVPISVNTSIVGIILALSPIALFALTKPASRPYGGFYFGTVFVLVYAWQWEQSLLPAILEQQDLFVVGYVTSLPVHSPSQIDKHPINKSDSSTAEAKASVTRTGGSGVSRSWSNKARNKFQFKVIRSNSAWSGGLVQLSWYGDLKVQAGESYRLKVRLNRPRGLVNDGLFDYEAWLFSRDIVATGYVRSGEVLTGSYLNRLQSIHHWIRQVTSQRISSLAKHHHLTPLLLALSVGESQAITTDMWRVLSATGTNHLLIISGLHVGLIAGMSLAFFNFLLKTFSRRLLVAGVLSGVVTTIYGLLAGFGLPVQRALTMVLVVYVAVILNRMVSVKTACCMALFFVVLINPVASLSTGFWLSFGAVFLLLYVFSVQRGELRIDSEGGGDEPGLSKAGNFDFVKFGSEKYVFFSHWLRQILYSQWVVFVGMAPLMLISVGQVSLVGFLANLVAIPFVSLIIVPVIFLSLPTLLMNDATGSWLIEFALLLLTWLWGFLRLLAEMELTFYSSSISVFVGLMAVVGIILVFAPTGLVPKWPALVLLLPMVRDQLPEYIEQGEIKMTLLDVGQGLSVVVRGANHTVVYDAGPSYGDRFDTGAQIVTPFLRRQGVSRIDKLIVSHNDTDHAGGVEAIGRNFRVGEVFRGEPVDKNDKACMKGGGWRLDGVNYSIVRRRDKNQAKNGNDRSCVVLIETKRYALLLPGDISSAAEEQLLIDSGVSVDLLVSPHHGSATSSGPAFLNRVNPKLVLVSAGYRNKFGHPNKAVISRYDARGIVSLNTAETGAITISTGNKPHVSFARMKPAGIWRNRGINFEFDTFDDIYYD